LAYKYASRAFLLDITWGNNKKKSPQQCGLDLTIYQILLLLDFSLRLAPSSRSILAKAIISGRGCRDFIDPLYLHHSE
jgi:hypothetical protein